MSNKEELSETKQKSGRNRLAKWAGKAGSSLKTSFSSENSSWPSNNQDHSRSLTSLSKPQDDAPPPVPIYAAMHYRVPEDDKLDTHFGAVFEPYTKNAIPQTPLRTSERRYSESLSRPLTGTARNELSDSNGRNALLPRSSLDTNGNLHINRRPAPSERQLTNESLKRETQSGRPNSQGRGDFLANEFHGPSAVVSRLQALTGYRMIDDAAVTPSIPDSPRRGARSPVLSIGSSGDFKSSEPGTFFNAAHDDDVERLDEEEERELRRQRDVISDDASVSEKETANHIAPERKTLRHIVYDRFCADFDELRDEKKNKHGHRVAKWVAKEAERQLLQDVQEVTKELDEKATVISRMRTQLEETIAEKEKLESAHATELESEKQRSAFALKKQREDIPAEVQRQVSENTAKLSQNHHNEINKKNRDMGALERQHKLAISQKVEEIARKDQAFREEISRKNEKIASRDREIESKQRMLERNKDEFETRLNDRVQALEENRKKWQNAFEKIRADREGEIKDLEQTHANTLEQKERAHDLRVSDLKGRLQSLATAAQIEKQELEAAHKAALTKRDEDHAADRSELIGKHNEETQSLREDVEKIESEAEKMEAGWKARNVRDLEEQKRTLTADNRKEIGRLEAIIQDMAEKQKRETQEVERKLAAEREKWQRQLRESNKANLSRDDEEYNLRNGTTGLPAFPSKPDETIQGNFQEIKDLVDELAGMTWKAEQRMWTPQVFQKIGSNQVQRLLRKAILQDLAWTVLFHGIFCSPFRVFGAEGETLERQWAEQCGDDDDPYEDGAYNWPPPGIQTERWRYMTIRECNQVLRNPASKWDPRAKLKKEFKGSYDDLVARLKAVLGDIAEIEDENVETIQKLAKRTAALWIDLEMHRCRIVVNLTGTPSRTTTEKVSLAQRRSFALTVVPSIGRYGNVEGLELDTFTVIDGCAGETLKIP